MSDFIDVLDCRELFAVLVAVVGDDATGTAQVVHEAMMRQGIYLRLRSLIRNRQDELVIIGELGLFVITTDQIKVTTPGCIYVMDH